MIENDIEDIKEIIKCFGGEIFIERSIVCKMSPHKQPEKFKGWLLIDHDFSVYSEFMIMTFLQRLKLLYYEQFKKIYSK